MNMKRPHHLPGIQMENDIGIQNKRFSVSRERNSTGNKGDDYLDEIDKIKLIKAYDRRYYDLKQQLEDVLATYRL